MSSSLKEWIAQMNLIKQIGKGARFTWNDSIGLIYEQLQKSYQFSDAIGDVMLPYYSETQVQL